MEKCAATVRALPTCSRKTPSQSADECKAHWNSKTGGSSVSQRITQCIIVARRRSDDGEKISEEGANYEGEIKGRTVRLWRAVVFVQVSGAFRTVRRWRAPCAARPSS